MNDNEELVGESGMTLADIVADIQHFPWPLGGPRILDIMAEYDLTESEACMVAQAARTGSHTLTCPKCQGRRYMDGFLHLYCDRCGGVGTVTYYA